MYVGVLEYLKNNLLHAACTDRIRPIFSFWGSGQGSYVGYLKQRQFSPWNGKLVGNKTINYRIELQYGRRKMFFR